MKTIKTQSVIRQALCLVCVPLLAGGLMVAQQPAPPAQAPAQLLPPEQLDTLVAPVALYPDALLSQVLVAATYPREIAEVGQWLQQNRNLQGSSTGRCGAPAELGSQYPGPRGFPRCGQQFERRHALDHRSRQRIPLTTGRCNECGAADAGPSHGGWQTAFQRAGNRHHPDAGRPIGD